MIVVLLVLLEAVAAQGVRLDPWRVQLVVNDFISINKTSHLWDDEYYKGYTPTYRTKVGYLSNDVGFIRDYNWLPVPSSVAISAPRNGTTTASIDLTGIIYNVYMRYYFTVGRWQAGDIYVAFNTTLTLFLDFSGESLCEVRLSKIKNSRFVIIETIIHTRSPGHHNMTEYAELFSPPSLLGSAELLKPAFEEKFYNRSKKAMDVTASKYYKDCKMDSNV